MGLSEESVIDKIEVLPQTRQIQVRRADRVLRNQRVIAEHFHRYVITAPHELTDQPPIVVAIAQAAWAIPTQE